MQQSTYGADREIPNTYAHVGFGNQNSATRAEIEAAGFHGGPQDPVAGKPGQQPLDEFLVAGTQTITPDIARQLAQAASYIVLRDPDGVIVATWDEGRWWTPSESDEFTRQIVEEMTGNRPNRAERRRMRRQRGEG